MVWNVFYKNQPRLRCWLEGGVRADLIFSTPKSLKIKIKLWLNKMKTGFMTFLPKADGHLLKFNSKDSIDYFLVITFWMLQMTYISPYWLLITNY